MTTFIEGSYSDTRTTKSSSGGSPYASGSGGVTFERKVAVQYLAHLLVGDSAVEFGGGRHAVSVAFQQDPDHPVDDLVICAARPDEPEPSWEIALEVRRSPKLVQSDEKAQRLFRKFVRALMGAPKDGIESRWGLVVAGPQTHAEQLAKLADLAAAQMDATGFFNLVRTSGKFDGGVRNRLDHVESLVERALKDLDGSEPDTALVRERAWQLLSRFVVRMPRLESPDETDWATVKNSLIGIARNSDLDGASRLRDRLVALASDYSPRAARVDLTLLRRDAHDAIDSELRRHKQGWSTLDHLHKTALNSVRDEIASNDGARRLSLDRSDTTRKLVATVSDAAAVLVSGDSGVGKSALTLLSLTALSAKDSVGAQILCINLRHLPKLTVDFEDRLGCPLSTLLCEISAPQRVLIVDGADAVTEGMEDAFIYLVDAAVASGVKVVAVTSTESGEIVRDLLKGRFGADLAGYDVKALTDTELDEIVKAFPELERLNANSRSRTLLRRLVVIDLLVRSGRLAGVPLSDADAMQEVWSGLVRRREKSDRGHPDAREIVLLRMAEISLSGGERLDAIVGLDSAAVDGLRRDGLLHSPSENPFMIGPDFAHDEVRRYAVSRLLLAERDPTSRILSAGAPRWALGAATLACQALLGEPDTPATPLRGRFTTLQASFDQLVEAEHGARWGDVPGEALVTIADFSAVLKDAWPGLRADDSAGLQRLARIVKQRLRKDNDFVDHVAVEPIIKLLLDEETPWRLGEYAEDLLREWLLGHVIADTPAGHPLRVLLRRRLAEACAAGDRRLDKEREDAAAARVARTPEEIEQERRFEELHPELFTEIGYGGRHRRQRPEVPSEYEDEVLLELLALLGPDLGDSGEEILLRVARDAPWALAPAVDDPFASRALSQYGRGLLAQLTEAYYLDDESDGLGIFDDGIRSHRARGVWPMPHAAWYLGPFIWLFRTDFRDGVVVLNRLLNHAALVRARALARSHSEVHSLGNMDISQYKGNLEITGTRRQYVGDEHVWIWYRGTGVGPYPCMSALQALERMCDQLIKADIPIRNLVPLLLKGCENLAMVGLVVGILVRHLEAADDLLNPYFIEPIIWHLEFGRVVNEDNGLAADSEGIEAPERRKWSLREAAMFMAVRVEDERAADLQALARTLVERGRRELEQGYGGDATDEKISDEDIEQQLATVKVWASCLDRSSFQVHEAQDQDGLLIQVTPPEEAVQALQHDNEELARVAEEYRLINLYFYKRNEADFEAVGPDDLVVDIGTARTLLENPTYRSVHHPWDVPALIAAAALEAHLLHRVDIPDDALSFAADTVLKVSEGEASPGPNEIEGAYFELGADRSAARVLPLLLTPYAALLRALVDGADGTATFRRASIAGIKIAKSIASEVRLHLARGLDYLWATPCVQDGPCHHQVGWQIVTETMRDCAYGDWIPETGRRSIIVLDEPLAESLTSIADDSILPSRLDASIRALAPAATANICVSTVAREMLTVLFATQRRALLCHERNDLDQRGTHSLVSARALLTLAQHGDDTAIYEFIDAYADNVALLSNLLRALAAAAEETPERAEVARQVWPGVVRHVLPLLGSGNVKLRRDFYGEMALAALIPNTAYDIQYFYRELEAQPIVWWEPLALRTEVEAWLTPAAGRARCVDQLIGFLKTLALEDQARTGLPWMATLVLASPDNVARGSFSLAEWLVETRSAAVSAGLSSLWQQIVDALVVEGVTRLAPYSE